MLPRRCQPSRCENTEVASVYGFRSTSSALKVKWRAIIAGGCVCQRPHTATFAATRPPTTGNASPCGTAMNVRLDDPCCRGVLGVVGECPPVGSRARRDASRANHDARPSMLLMGDDTPAPFAQRRRSVDYGRPDDDPNEVSLSFFSTRDDPRVVVPACLEVLACCASSARSGRIAAPPRSAFQSCRVSSAQSTRATHKRPRRSSALTWWSSLASTLRGWSSPR
mmetsp:Transcript_17373/g.69806  ORF Transcript_17373/g.69806 Transcript_17373/m.69806 type:complete len:224 (+) Transcript_17373:699-1370(+)